MASNFWRSTHARWLMPGARAGAAHRDDLAQGLPRARLRELHAALAQWAFDVAHAARLRQRVAATALVYFRRLYAAGGGAGPWALGGAAAAGAAAAPGNQAGAASSAAAAAAANTSFGAHDPRVVILGAVCLAAKAEESAVAVRALCAAARRLRPGWPHDARAVLDAEALLVDALGARLCVYDPYAPLEALLRRDPRLAELGQNAWAALNDAFRSPDLPLRHAPHALAAGALYLACVACGRDVDGGAWLAREAGADLDAVMDVVAALTELYEEQGAEDLRVWPEELEGGGTAREGGEEKGGGAAIAAAAAATGSGALTLLAHADVSRLLEAARGGPPPLMAATAQQQQQQQQQQQAPGLPDLQLLDEAIAEASRLPPEEDGGGAAAAAAGAP
jgi:cyclin C